MKLLDSILWAIATILILYSGIFYTFKLKFVQFRFIDMFKNLFKKTDSKVSPFESLMIVLGGRIGVGSIAGIALSIYLGGVGSIFWMWIIGFISAPLSFSETILGIKYQKKVNDEYIGGPSNYLKYGLNKPNLSKLYSFIIVFSYIGGFLSIQANTITTSIVNYININPLIIGITLALISFIIILGGVNNISKVSKYLVPIMSLIYILASFFIIVINYEKVPLVFMNILSDAFNIKSFGFGVISSMIVGIQRGIFSNEAGLGTGAIAASCVNSNPASCGFVQMIGIYITTFLICTATALVILTTDNLDVNVINGIELTQEAFIMNLGSLGNIVVILSIILFAFSTVLSGYYDGEASLKSIFPNISKNKLLILKIVTFIVILFGSITKANLIWSFVNILTSLLAIINSYVLIKLYKEVVFEYKRYNKCGKIK